jgi:phospholipid/cholesterol/gamma-HCH transport system permease protein
MQAGLKRTFAEISQILKLIAKVVLNFFKTLEYLFKSKIFLPNLISYGARFTSSVTLPTIVIAIALGVVIGVQLGPQFVSKGVGSKLGILALLTMSRELVPIMGGFMIATQYGTAITAEIANMQITEQLDALKILRINPIYYLVLPAMLAGLVLAPLVFWLAVILGTYSTFLTVWINEGLVWSSFQSGIMSFFHISDMLICLIKACLFTVLIVIISATIGMNVRKGGAREVGTATTTTVIAGFITVIICDLICTMVYLE